MHSFPYNTQLPNVFWGAVGVDFEFFEHEHTHHFPRQLLIFYKPNVFFNYLKTIRVATNLKKTTLLSTLHPEGFCICTLLHNVNFRSTLLISQTCGCLISPEVKHVH